MWVKTKSGELVNMDNVSRVGIGEDDTVGGQRTKCLHAFVGEIRIRLTNPGPATAPHEKSLARIENALVDGRTTVIHLSDQEG